MILAVGTLSFDVIGSAAHPFRNDSLTMHLDAVEYSNGGRGANFAVFTQALAADTALCSSVGNDFRGSAYESDLRTRRVDLSRLFWNPSFDTPHIFVFSNGDDARVFSLRDRRPESERSYCDWTTLHARDVTFDVLYCTSEVPLVNCCALEVSSARLKVFAPAHDLDLYDRTTLLRCLRSADVVIVNAAEAHAMEQLIGNEFRISQRRLTAFAITQGSGGCTVFCGGEWSDIEPAQPAKVVDSTGAGDAYAAGFVVEFLRSGDSRRSAQVGNVVASLAIESLGCQSSVPTPEEVSMRLEVSYR